MDELRKTIPEALDSLLAAIINQNYHCMRIINAYRGVLLTTPRVFEKLHIKVVRLLTNQSGNFVFAVVLLLSLFCYLFPNLVIFVVYYLVRHI